MTKIIIKKLTLQNIIVYMIFYKNIVKICCVALMLFISFSCTNKGIIPAKKMSKIIAEMYLADQYVEMMPQMRSQADSMKLYTGILKKFGYNESEYVNSVRYYLSRSNDMLNIHLNAKQILMKRKRELEKIAPKLDKRAFIMNAEYDSEIVDTLYKNPYNRAVKWIIAPYTYGNIRFFEIEKSDIPVNAQWWKNNMTSKSDSLFIFIKPSFEKSTTTKIKEKKTKTERVKIPANKKIIEIGKPIKLEELEQKIEKNRREHKTDKLRKKLRKEESKKK